MTWKNAIRRVLEESSEPLHYREITEKILTNKLKENVGATPAATVAAQITSSIKHDGEKSPFIRVGKGLYSLRDKIGNLQEIRQEIDEDEEDIKKEVVSSFGMFWRREAVEWKRSPSLLGMQQLGSEPVNFSSQIGIYLLYDGREVVYVGRSTDRPLGRRLYEHTIDRLSARWNRFSWFGFLPVDEKGRIGELPETYSAKKIIPMLEAVLIEALEPRQNRRRGDDLEAVEYLQVVDPEIEKRKLKAIIDKL
ncbi:HTH domain-containing protein [Nitratifractor sp.]|uniref:HTH domain-containing protein n=1 Tax=Nitratifractor sp. TaxID=2268144 RepID=UPI0025D1BFC5|nr:HTH domain-containing protein [Nitratifractor sp.]